MRKFTQHIMALVLVGTMMSAAVAGPSAETIAKIRCASCHGAKGMSSNDLWPNLAGQKAAYLEKQINAFRSKTRVDPVMNAMVAGITDADAKALGSYYASLKPE